MLASFLIVFPIFAVIALGWFTARVKLLKQETGNGIADFVFVVAVPLMLFRTLATAPLPPSPPWLFWLSYFAGLGTVWVIASVVSTKVFGRGSQEAAIIGFTAAQSNMVLLGIPLVLRVFGDEASVPLFLMIAVHLPVAMTVATFLIERAEPGQSKGLVILSRLIRNPVLVGIAAGMATRLIGIELPAPLLSTLKFFADAAAPCALFATGMALNRHGLSGDMPLLGVVAVLKLLVHPALVFVLTYYVFGLPAVWVGVATVLAGCPCGVNAYLLAERYGVGMRLSSGAVLLTTLLAAGTSTMLVWLLLR